MVGTLIKTNFITINVKIVFYSNLWTIYIPSTVLSNDGGVEEKVIRLSGKKSIRTFINLFFSMFLCIFNFVNMSKVLSTLLIEVWDLNACGLLFVVTQHVLRC